MTENHNRMCFATLERPEPWSLKAYESVGGYRAWKEILAQRPPRRDLIEQVKGSGLRGRGGAGFPTGVKWGFMPDCDESYLVCNADESEPGTCKDRDILRFNPHALIEGMAIACYAIGAGTGYAYLREEFGDEPYRRFQGALREAYENGMLGPDIRGSGITVYLHDTLGAGAYICGEETALLESLEGKKGFPRFKPPFPAHYGLWGRPTTVNNVETLALVPGILRGEPGWRVGTEKSRGTRCFSVSGHVSRPGNHELPLGIPFADLLELCGGVWKNRELKAVIPGGSSVPVLPAEAMMGLDMDFESLAEAGSMLGSGAVIVMDETTDMVRVLQRISRFYFQESCGQCTPCREGTGWLYRVLTRIVEGRGGEQDLEILEKVPARIEGHTICALGDAAAWPVQGMLRHFRDEFEHYIRHGKSPVGPA